MGMFDDYFYDPQTFSGESGGLLGRLLSLQSDQGQLQPGAGFDPPPTAPQTPLSMPVSLPVSADNGQAPSVSQAQPADIGDRLSAGFQNWARTPVGSPMAAIANAVTGLGSGQRTDTTGAAPSQTSSSAPMQPPDLGDRLSAGFQNWAHTPVGSPMAALANGIAGFNSGQRAADPGTAPQMSQARIDALKFLRSADQDAASPAIDPQAGNPPIAQAPARQSANARPPLGYTAPPPGAIPRKSSANVPRSVRPLNVNPLNVNPWSIK
jgi:hypothetical protein